MYGNNLNFSSTAGTAPNPQADAAYYGCTTLFSQDGGLTVSYKADNSTNAPVTTMPAYPAITKYAINNARYASHDLSTMKQFSGKNCIMEFRIENSDN